MSAYINYIIESSICLTVLYGIYLIFIQKETWFALIRGYLLFSMAFSLIVPLLEFTFTTETALTGAVLLDGITVSTEISYFSGSTVNWTNLLFSLITAISALFVVRLFWHLVHIYRLIQQNGIEKRDGYRIVLLEEQLSPFSFFRYVFLNRKYRQEDMNEILKHEQVHIRQLHSIDVLLSELLIALQWFNPVVWLYRRTISENHEYLADRSVINNGYSVQSYQVQILSQLFGIRTVPATNNFNKSITKKRLNMMEKTKSSRLTRLKLLLVLPALVILFLALACSKQDAGLLPGMEADENSASATENLTYFKPDEMAEYPGGFMALRKYIAIHVKYPEIARKKGVQGKVYVQFVVDEEGKVIPAIAKSAAEIPPPPPKTESGEKQTSSKKTEEEMMVATSAEGIVVVAFRPPEGGSADYDPEAVEALKQEAIRVVQSLPAFEKPARHSGEPVRSIYTFPINFVLQ